MMNVKYMPHIYQEFDFEENYDTAYGIIKIPANTVFYRGHSTKHGSVTDRPSYFSSKSIAELYVKSPEYTVSAFTNIKELRLLDVRFMMNILRDMFYSNSPDLASLSVILSFGLCSLHHQVNLLNKRYLTPNEGHLALQKILDEHDPASLYEPQGVRVGETINDAEAMSFLRTLFDGFIDGYIAPRIDSPYHLPNKYILPEMIIFNPWKSGITVMRDAPSKNLPRISLYTTFFSDKDHHIINYRNTYSHMRSPPVYETRFYLASGGGQSQLQIPTIELINERWDEEEIQNLVKKGESDAGKWKYKVHFGFYHPPAPTMEVIPWTEVPASIVPAVTAVSLQNLKERRKHKTRKLRR
jgi:hypothetical protein